MGNQKIKILIIDNGTKHYKALANILVDYELHSISNIEMFNKDFFHYDLLILTGSSTQSVPKFVEQHTSIREVLYNSHKPIIGICWGAQLLAYIEGSIIKRHAVKCVGLTILEKTPHKLYNNFESQVYVSHRYTINKIGEYYQVLGKISNLPSVIIHRHQPFLGFTFHPEVATGKHDSSILLHNAIQLLLKGL